jgi:hypothetical protein
MNEINYTLKAKSDSLSRRFRNLLTLLFFNAFLICRPQDKLELSENLIIFGGKFVIFFHKIH